MKGMRLSGLFLVAAAVLFAADEQRLALVMEAQRTFERVEMAAPSLRDASTCVQTQAAMLSVANPDELVPLHYRKGYCTLAGAAITGEASAFTEAAGEFEKAIASWPARAAAADRNKPPEPPPTGLKVLAEVARLRAGADAGMGVREREELVLAVANPVCSPGLMSPDFCRTVTALGKQWLGWLALRRDDLWEAARDFSGASGTGWGDWVAGLTAFQDGKYRDAAGDYRRAIELARPRDGASLADLLGPRPDVPADLVELGGAELLAGDAPRAIGTLDEAVRARPSNARALFLRARAKELAGKKDAALADYNMASRTAFAAAHDLASGEAHLYRGILLYRREDYAHAEDEFSSALNFEIPASLRGDAVAWRHLAAVAGGACDASRQFLERSLGAASPYFPKDEARHMAQACAASGTAENGGPK